MSIIDKIDKKYKPSLNDGELIITEPEYDIEIIFNDIDDEQYILNEIALLNNIKYVEGSSLYRDDYFEIIISLPNIFFRDVLGNYDFAITDKDKPQDNIWFSIEEISNIFNQFLDSTVYREIGSEGLFSIKAYNINKVLGENCDSDSFYKNAINIIKSFLFFLSFKYNINFTIVDKYEEFNEFEDPYYDVLNDLEINNTKYQYSYDKELVSYYYRANQLDNNEFKYIAFFQVIECLFDEVYNYINIQDIKSIINSSWFNPTKDDDILKVIEIVDRYSKEKNDRSKTYLVLDKYFKTELHAEAYTETNKEITDILINDLKLFMDQKDINDLHKLANIIYDFRCICTHSNRMFNKRVDFDYNETDLENYILLIKKISEKIIINYGI